MRIAITGASGYLGGHLIPYALDRGAVIHALAYRHRPDAVVHANLTWFQGSITNADTLRSLVHDVDVVIHLASYVHRPTVTSPDRTLCYQVNVGGMQTLLEAVQMQPAPPFVIFSSSAAVYSPSDSLLKEDDLCQPVSLYGSTKLEAEHTLLDLVKQGRVEGCVLRPATIYGPKAPGNMRRLFSLVESGIVPLINAGTNRKSMVYIENAVRAIWACLQAQTVTNGKIYNLSDEPPLQMQEITQRIAAALDKSPLIIPVPLWAAQVPLWLHDRLVGRLRGKTYLPTLHAFSATSVINSQRLTRETGYRQPISSAEGILRMAEWYRHSAKEQG